MNLLQYVNPLQGTDSSYQFSNGNTLPLITLPFGMSSYSPQTNEEGERWFYHPSHHHFQGLRLTHQSSPWIGDYGHLVLMPQTGKLCLSPADRASSFVKHKMSLHPDYFKIELLRYQTTLELTPAARSSFLRIRYGGGEEPRLLLSTFPGEANINIEENKRRITGYTRANCGGTPENFAMYFVLQFDCDFDMTRSGIFDSNWEVIKGHSATADKIGGYTGLKPIAGLVNIRLGTSFISVEQAQRNLASELGDKSFEEVRREASGIWEDVLRRIRIEEVTEEQRYSFYTCFYRTCLFPRVWYEFDEKGNKIHYSPYNGKIESGPMYADNGFWDTFRTVYPMFSILFPSRLGEILEAWTNAYKESGWMPRWVSPGERSSMPGTLIDAVFADAVAKDIKGYDRQTAYEGLRKHALEESADSFYGRKGLSYYNRLGYLPCDRFEEGISSTLDYSYGDFCIARIAQELGYSEDYRFFMKRAENYKKLYNPKTGFMQSRREDGSFQTPFDPLEWGSGFCEGGAWQCSWAVMHDLRGLADGMGENGREIFKNRLLELLNLPPEFKIGTYPCEIHEMTEMALAGLGQFAINNQPSFHIPYIFTALGYPQLTRYWVRKTLEEKFSDAADGLPGDEDNGSLCAWYLFGAMGLYPLTPGTPEYVLGSPLFHKMTIQLENGKQLVIEAIDQHSDHKYVKEIRWNQRTYKKLYLTHEQLSEGGHLLFIMDDKEPEERDYAVHELPYSMSEGKKTL